VVFFEVCKDLRYSRLCAINFRSYIVLFKAFFAKSYYMATISLREFTSALCRHSLREDQIEVTHVLNIPDFRVGLVPWLSCMLLFQTTYAPQVNITNSTNGE
jgi:hypothetical protein